MLLRGPAQQIGHVSGAAGRFSALVSYGAAHTAHCPATGGSAPTGPPADPGTPRITGRRTAERAPRWIGWSGIARPRLKVPNPVGDSDGREVYVAQRRSRTFDPQAEAAEIAGAASAEAAYQAVHEGEAPLEPGTDLTAAAFFDVDNTMMQGASIFHFARGLVARNFFTTQDLVRFALLQVKTLPGGERADGRCLG